jgi:hypothetical protein
MFFVPGLQLIGFHLVEKGVEALEVACPDFAVFFEPFGGLDKRLGFEAAGAALSVLAPGDEAGAFKNFEVFGDGGLSHLEGLGEFQDGGLAGGEASEDGAASGIGESGEGGIESIGRGHCITHGLYNYMVIYEAKRIVKPESFGGREAPVGATAGQGAQICIVEELVLLLRECDGSFRDRSEAPRINSR